MKKAYVKPALVMESFVLSQSIALGCKIPGEDDHMGTPGYGSKESCGWDVGGGTLWLENTGCTIPMLPNDDFNGICYNNPSGNFTIFAS